VQERKQQHIEVTPPDGRKACILLDVYPKGLAVHFTNRLVRYRIIYICLSYLIQLLEDKLLCRYPIRHESYHDVVP
jgi:hypothetical protein